MDVQGMQNARLGALYLWQGIDYDCSLASVVLNGALSSASGLAGIKEVNIPNIGQAADLVADGIDTAREMDANGLTAWGRIKQWAQDFCTKVWGKIKETFGDLAEVAGHIKSIAVAVAQMVFKDAAPIIGGVVDMVQGLWRFTTVFVTKLGNWLASKGVRLVQGHPKTVIEGIKKGLTRDMLVGLKDLAKGAISITVNVTTAGAGAILDGIAAVVEAAVKIIYRVWQHYVLKDFVAEAKAFWLTKGDDTSIHLDSMKFNRWLKPATNKVPLIAAVTLGTGVAGDKMRFLQMYSEHGQVISSSQFKSGVRYLDKMKRSGAQLMEWADIEFTSRDPVITGLLRLAKSHHEVHAKKSGFWAKLFRKTDKFMRT